MFLRKTSKSNVSNASFFCARANILGINGEKQAKFKQHQMRVCKSMLQTALPNFYIINYVMQGTAILLNLSASIGHTTSNW